MNRRVFLSTAAVGSTLPLLGQNYSDYTKDPRPDVAEGTLTAGSLDGPVFAGSPIVAGPAPEAMTILQPRQRHATGHLEFAVENESGRRVDAEHAGLLPWSEHVSKFRLPPLPPGKSVRYRDTYPTERRWECHSFCRDLWLPKLTAAGVKLVVSGPTHDHRWMPAKAGQPIAQLIGGAPQPRFATFIQLAATRERLTLKMSKLDGTTLAEATI